eukprot:scaffold216992_cov19-Tisochrysis_lutea.AAC.1
MNGQGIMSAACQIWCTLCAGQLALKLTAMCHELTMYTTRFARQLVNAELCCRACCTRENLGPQGPVASLGGARPCPTLALW